MNITHADIPSSSRPAAYASIFLLICLLFLIRCNPAVSRSAVDYHSSHDSQSTLLYRKDWLVPRHPSGDIVGIDDSSLPDKRYLEMVLQVNWIVVAATCQATNEKCVTVIKHERNKIIGALIFCWIRYLCTAITNGDSPVRFISRVGRRRTGEA